MKRIYLTALLFCFFLSSCNEKSNYLIEKGNDVGIALPKISNQASRTFISFGSIEELDSYIANLEKKSFEEVDEALAKINKNGFISYLDAMYGMTDEEKEKVASGAYTPLFYLTYSEEEGMEANPKVENYILQNILNQDAIIRVGKDAIKYDRGERTIISDFSVKKLEEMTKGLSTFIPRKNVSEKGARGIASALPRSGTEFRYWNSGIRMKIKYNYGGLYAFGFWNKLTLTAKLQDRIALVWWPEKADYIKVNCYSPLGMSSFLPNHNCAKDIKYYSNNDAFIFQKSNPLNFTVHAEAKWKGDVRSNNLYR